MFVFLFQFAPVNNSIKRKKLSVSNKKKGAIQATPVKEATASVEKELHVSVELRERKSKRYTNFCFSCN